MDQATSLGRPDAGGMVSFGTGVYLAWFEQQDRGFAIGITTGGLLQLNAQRSGYAAIISALAVPWQCLGRLV